MTSSPFFTVGVPTIGRADHYLPLTIRSLLRQSHTDFELLISDNASTDNTADVVASFNDPRIRYIRHKERLSAGSHFAAIAAAAHGRYFVLNQDDDLLHLDFLQRAYKGLLIHPEALLFASPIWREQPNRGYSSVALRPREGYSDDVMISDTPFLVDGFYAAAKFFDLKLHFVHPALAISTEHLAAIGGYDAGQDYSVDLVTQARILLRGPLLYDPRPGGIFRVHEGNYSRTMKRDYRKSFYKSTYTQLIAVFESAGSDWKTHLDAYLKTLQFGELAEIVHEWVYYRTPIDLQRVGLAALERAWSGSRLTLLRKLGSRLGWRNLARYLVSSTGTWHHA